MEKLTLFDLIGKFGAAAAGNKSFSRPQASSDGGPSFSPDGGSGTSRRASPSGGKEGPKEKGVLVDPEISSPPAYRMNGKMADFCKKHDALSAEISASVAGRKNSCGRKKKEPSSQKGKGSVLPREGGSVRGKPATKKKKPAAEKEDNAENPTI